MLQLALLVSLLSQSLPDGPGKDLVEAVCTACHDATRIIAKQGTKADWQSKVLEMLQECPDVSQDERERIVEYLARSFPKHINVNTAPAKEIEAVLEIPTKEAEAIVRYRQEKGNFKKVDDLRQVPGVDSSKLETIKNRIEF